MDKPFVVAFDIRTEENHDGPEFGFMAVDQHLMDRVLYARQQLLANDFKHIYLECRSEGFEVRVHQ